MLHEFLTYLTTPCPPAVRRMGYVRELIAMRGRYKRRRIAWEPHLDNTRRCVRKAAERCRNRNKVVVLGAGLLLDVPLAELSSLFQEVILMDIVCLPEVRKRIKGYDNVTFVERDVTSIAQRLYSNKRQGRYDLPEPVPAFTGIDDQIDLVVSLNILSQLTVVPREYAIRHLPGLAEDQVDEWCGRIVESHIAALRALTCSVRLVADYEFVKRDRDGNVFSRGSTVSGLTLPKPDSSWIWTIAPLGEESRAWSKELMVGAWSLR